MRTFEYSAILDFLSQTIQISLDQNIADIAAELRRNHKIKVADSIVAATALFTNSKLITRNDIDFRVISELKTTKI